MVTTGAMLGKYQLEEVVGSSGLATVYRAYDSVTGRPVALKVLHAYFSQEEELVRPFFQELAVVAQWRHPNIVPLYDYGRDGDTWWLASEWVQGISLRDYHTIPLPINVAAHIAGQVAEALKFAHQHGVIHRNLKPSNVFLTSDGRVLLADFAMATLGERVHPLIKMALTTPMPSFMSPEHAAGGPVDPKSDVYSLGALLYWMLTDSPPYLADSPQTVYIKQMNYTPFAPSQLNSSLPKRVDGILLKALAPFPAARYQSLDELVDDVALVAEGWVALDPSAYLPREREAARLAQTPTASSSGAKATSLSFPLLEKLYIEGVPKPGREAAVATVAFMLLALAVMGAVSYRAIQPPPTPPPPLTSVSSDSPPYQWAMARHDGANTGFSPWAPPFVGELKWTYATSAPILSSPVVSDGAVFLATGDNRVLALDAADGKVLWEFKTTGPMDSSPTVAGDLLYVGLRDFRLLAIERATGRLRWEFGTDNPISAAAVVYNGVVYLASGDEWLYALDAATGELRWKFHVGGWIYSSPGVKDGKVVVGAQREVYILDAANGQNLFAFDALGAVTTSPALEDGRVYVGSYQLFWALDLNTRSAPFDRQFYRLQAQLFLWGMAPPPPPLKGRVWSHRIAKKGFSSAAVAHGTVFVGAEDGKVYAWDAARGDKRWEFQTKGPVFSAPVVGNDTLYVGSDDGRLYALDARSGEKKWEFATKGKVRASPAVTRDALYITSYDGQLYALK